MMCFLALLPLQRAAREMIELCAEARNHASDEDFAR